MGIVLSVVTDVRILDFQYYKEWLEEVIVYPL
jgi:hypothetical protein